MFKKIQNFEILKVILGSKRSKKDSKSYKIAIFTQFLFFFNFWSFFGILKDSHFHHQTLTHPDLRFFDDFRNLSN